MTVTIRPASLDDASAIRLRPTDYKEALLWAPGHSPAFVLHSTIEHATEAWTAVEEGRVLAVAGYTLEGPEVFPWLMCSRLERRHHKVLLRHARDLLSRLRVQHPQALICNYLHRPNQEARAFINHLGFRVLPTPGGRAEFDLFYLPPCAPTPSH